jgi:MFS family permease
MIRAKPMPPADCRSALALPAAPGQATGSPWGHVLKAAAALAAGMGVGRFVYTPILPLMHSQAGLGASAGASLATANYIGYLVGALAGILAPRLVRSRVILRISLILLTVTLLAMPLTHAVAVWWALRLLAGVASALVFVIAASSLLSHLRGLPAHLPGWGFGGVGAGIALSGGVVLILRSVGDWRSAWWASAALAAVLAAGAWTLRPEPSAVPASGPVGATRPASRPRTQRWFGALFACYSLEGVGYIIAGTFLVAAIEQTSPGWIGSGAWVLVGLAAVPSSAFWAWLSRRWSRPDLLLAALVVQAVGCAWRRGGRRDLRGPVRCHLPGHRHDRAGRRGTPAVPALCSPADRWLLRRADPRPAHCHAAAASRLPPGVAGGRGRDTRGRSSGSRLADRLPAAVAAHHLTISGMSNLAT